jgi:hypothetical protein
MGTDNDRTMFKLGIALVGVVLIVVEVVFKFEFEPRRFSRERSSLWNDIMVYCNVWLYFLCYPLYGYTSFAILQCYFTLV